MLSKEILDSGRDITDELYIKAILWKIRSLFGSEKDQADFLNEIKELKAKELARQAEAQRLLEEAEKKNKKAPPPKVTNNKNAKAEPVKKVEEIVKSAPVQKTYFYTSGWVLLDFPRTLSQVLFFDIFSF